MGNKKGFNVYHLLLSEGTTEFNLFAYLTRNRFRGLFEASSVKFSNNVEIIKNGNQVVSQGKLGGVGNVGDFRASNTLIKEKYPGQRLFYFLDKDIDDSTVIGALINADGDIIQFVEYNSEHLLLKLGGKNPKDPAEFANLKDFRDYCKQEFVKQFGKHAHKFKDVDFELVFNNSTEDEIRDSFNELFATLT